MWRWIPLSLNVADLATKSSKFMNMSEWLRGSELLRYHQSEWSYQECIPMSSNESVNYHMECEGIEETSLL